MQVVLDHMRLFKVNLRMWDFGGPTQKGTILYSNRDWIHEVLAYRMDRYGEKPQSKLCTYTRDKKGRTKFTANTNLKQSQAYPAGFGTAMSKLFAAHKEDLARECAEVASNIETATADVSMEKLATMLEHCLPEGNQGWPDARLEGVLAYLSIVS